MCRAVRFHAEVIMSETNRRQFLLNSGAALGLANVGLNVHLPAAPFAQAPRAAQAPLPGPNNPALLYNTNLQTAIGMGDEPPGIVDKFGQLRTRNVQTTLELGSPLAPASGLEWSQSLRGGYAPMVDTQVRSPQGMLRWSVFTSDVAGITGDYLEIPQATALYRVTLWFPYTLSIKVAENYVFSEEDVLAVFPPPDKMSVAQARYNFLSTGAGPSETHAKPLPHTDPAYNLRIVQGLDRDIRYRFPITSGATYHVFLGMLTFRPLTPGGLLMRLSVGDLSRAVDVGLSGSGVPVLEEFVVRPTDKEILVKVECDPSATNPGRPTLLNGIWIFDHPVDAAAVKEGKLSQEAVFYVQCGREELRDRACSVALDYSPHAPAQGSHWFRFPYKACSCQTEHVADIRPEEARTSTQQGWDSFLSEGAEISTGVRHLDNLYKTSLINILLLRTRLEKSGNNGDDLYVLKPGATTYDAFWYRDGAYLVTALDVAGYHREAEQSLRLFWQANLQGAAAAMGQQASGAWQCPLTEWDGQGQALWALVHHFEVTRDLAWLRQVYPSIRRGAAWIKNVTEQTQFLTERGEKPIYFGLLPEGDGEAIGNGYIYYHNFWAVLGLREAFMAAQALEETADAKWIKETCDQFCANLMASVKRAYAGIGNQQFIPGSAFDPRLDIWGSLAALYPSRLLDPNDLMMTRTLDRMAAHAKEDEYVFQDRDKIWTYITVDWALCYLLRDDLPMFYRLFNGYVAHASPTNAWIEEIYPDTHIGTGDMPHGWAAGQYVHLLRNSLLFENENVLELCWGVQAEWLKEGAKVFVKNAPTRFGKVDFALQRHGTELALDYHLAATVNPQQVRLHIPSGLTGIELLRINDHARELAPGTSVIDVT
jgi:hypothetical protein